MSSTTRLLVLGVIRIMQPVHGYDVRRELLSWRLGDLANVKPGSVYGAMRTLLKDGCIDVHSRDSAESRPEKTSYVLTGEGEKEFQMMLREAWWGVSEDPRALIPAMTLMMFMPRDELVRALQARIGRIESDLDATAMLRGTIRDGADPAQGEIPEHVREILDFKSSLRRAELQWTKQFQQTVRGGAYCFAGEAGAPRLGPGRGVNG